MFEGWILLDPEKVPERWRGRARLVALVPMLPGELSDSGGEMVGGDDVRLMGLVAQGRSTDAIARELGISTRSVQRAISRLRQRYGVTTKAELSTVLSKAGF